MTEGAGEHKPGPNEENPRPAHEISFDKVMKLPSNAILDGIYAGSIRDPDAVRAYFIRKRTEFLEAHPDREDELDKPGELGRWHGLVYSETAAEYGGLADFCESEVRRRTAGLSGQELDRPTHRQGVTNFKLMAELWRQRAVRASENEPESHPLPLPPSPPVTTPEAVTRPETPVGRPDYDHMLDYQVLDGIDKGSLTDPEAVHVYIRKSLDSIRRLYEGDELAEKEADYTELVYGDRAALARFCVGQSRAWVTLDEPSWRKWRTPAELAAARKRENPAHYDIAARWYLMASRITQPAVEDIPSPGMQPARQLLLHDQLAGMSAEEVRRAIEDGSTGDTNAVQIYIQKSLQRDRVLYEGERLHDIEAQYADLVFADPRDMIRYCLEQAQGVTAITSDLGAASRWYAMASRFAQDAARDRRDEKPQVSDED